MTAINLAEKVALIGDPWVPKTVAAVNDYDIKVVKVDGEFVWRDHAGIDELFLVHERAADDPPRGW